MQRGASAAVILVLAALTGPTAPAAAQSVAITNARVYTMSGAPLEDATVLMRDGRIAAIGTDVDVPSGTRVIDGTGKVVTPGFMDSATRVGLVEVDAYGSTRDYAVSNDRVTAAFNVADGYNPLSTLVSVTRVEGITRAVVQPRASGSLIAGQGIVVDLGPGTADDHITLSPAGMFVSLGERGAGLAGGARGAAMLMLREALQDALDYAGNRTAYESADRRDYALSRLDLEALVPVVRGEVPLVVSVDRASDILAALRLRDEFDLHMILYGAAEGWMVADRIRAADVPVVVFPMQNIPDFEQLGTTLENAARLHESGVTVALATGNLDGTTEASNTRNLKQAAGNAVAYGMPHRAALEAITRTPAEIWGVADRYGTLEPGQDADVVVWSGDPLELTTLVEHVFIHGAEMPDRTRQRMLFERYRDVEEYPQAYD